MKRNLLLGILIVICCGCGRKTAHDDRIAVLSYNIRHSGGDDGDNSWKFRRESSLAMFRDIGPDLAGMQEVLKDQLDYIAGNMPEYGVIGTGRDDGNAAGEMMAVMYRKERFEMVFSDSFWLSETPGEVSRGWDGACNRMVTWMLLKDRLTGKNIYFFNTHLDHAGERARGESVKLIAGKIDEIAGKGTVILTGDFNAAEDDGIMAPLAGMLDSARGNAPETDFSPTFNGWGKESITYPIDHIFYRGVEPVSFTVVKDGYGSAYLSDHYPVKAVFGL